MPSTARAPRIASPSAILRSALACAALLCAAVPSRAADNRIEVRSGHRITGDLAGADVDSLTFVASRRAELSLRVIGADGLRPVVSITGPGGEIALDTIGVGQGTARFYLKRLPLPESGTWILRIQGAGTAGRYVASIRIDCAKAWTEAIATDARGATTWVLDALPAATRARIELQDASGSAPSLLDLRDEGGAAIAVEALRESARSTSFEISAASSQRRVALWIEGAAASSISVRIRVLPSRRERVDVSLVGDPAPPARARTRAHPNSGFETWLQLDRVPFLEPGRRSGGFSSFDRSGGNDDGFSGGGGSWLDYRVDPTSPIGFEIILLDLAGAGILNRMHFAFLSSGPPPFYDPNADRYDLRFYFDGAVTPTFVVPLREFVAGASPAWPYPLAADEFQAVGGPFNNTPLPFRSGLRITATGVPHFFDFQYVRWPDAATLRTYDLGDDPRDVRAVLQESGRDPKPVEESTLSRVIALEPEPGVDVELFSASGAGSIERIDFALDPGQPFALEELWLEARFDGAIEPQAAAPLGDWVGCSAGFADIDALYFRLRTDGHGSIFWPMPFASSAQLVLRHRGTVARGRIVFTVAWDVRPFGADCAHLNVHHRDQRSVAGRDVVLFDRAGRGKIVGVCLVGISDAPGGPRGYLEGDERIFLDGSRSPAIHGTGTEEFFGWGWYDAPIERRFSLPQHGSPYRLFDGIQDVTAQYRILCPDVIHFETHARVALECGPQNLVETAGMRYRSTVFAYALDAPALVLTDTFDPASSADALAHGYVALGSQTRVDLTSSYEGDVLTASPLADRGLELRSGAIEFDLNVDVRNRGARLRRRIDQFERAGQTASVYVDGVLAGTWREALNNQVRRWLDTDFELPERLTAGKSRVRVRLEPQRYPWNEFHYQVWSRLP